MGGKFPANSPLVPVPFGFFPGNKVPKLMVHLMKEPLAGLGFDHFTSYVAMSLPEPARLACGRPSKDTANSVAATKYSEAGWPTLRTTSIEVTASRLNARDRGVCRH